MITAARRESVIATPIAEAAAAAEVDSRTRALLRGAIVPTLLRLAWPNILVMLAQASTGLIETWWVSHLGTDALAGMALVFPTVMLMQMVSAGAMGGGISSTVARALGAGARRMRWCCMRWSSTSPSALFSLLSCSHSDHPSTAP